MDYAEDDNCTQLAIAVDVLLERARIGDFTVLAPLMVYARTNNDQAVFALFLDLIQRGNDIASNLVEECLRKDDPEAISFLVEYAQKGDPTAFTLLCKKYEKPLSKYFEHIIRDKEAGHDIMQETLLQAWQGLPKAHEETKRKFKAWLFRIAHNQAIDYLRQNQASVWSLDELKTDTIDETSSDFESRIAETELVKRALSQIKPHYRKALLIEAFQNRSQREKAESLGIKESTFSSKVRRGREELRYWYKRLASESETTGGSTDGE